jgi:hypothetical protein
VPEPKVKPTNLQEGLKGSDNASGFLGPGPGPGLALAILVLVDHASSRCYRHRPVSAELPSTAITKDRSLAQARGNTGETKGEPSARPIR